jgi:hypothetical protein
MTKKNYLILSLSVMLLLALSILPMFSAVQSAVWDWQDDFVSMNSRWSWSYRAGTGYHRLATVDGCSVAESGITAASTAYAYSDCSLHYMMTIASDDYVIMETRAKFSHSLMDGVSKGSQGCIIWNGAVSNAFGFFVCSPESTSEMSGFRVALTRDGVFYINKYIGDTYNPTDWHVYRIEVDNAGTKFYIDDNLVAQTSQKSRIQSGGRLDFWVDNAAYQASGARYYLDVTLTQTVYMDYVYFYQSSAPAPTPTPTPTPTATPTPSPTPTPTPSKPECCYFDLTFEEEIYVVETYSNSSVSALTFNWDLKRIRFSVEGESGTSGFCDIIVPRELMSGQFSLHMDGVVLVEGVDYTQSFNNTHYLFTVNYEHSSHVIELYSTDLVPDFAGWLFLPLVTIATLLGLKLIKRVKKDRKPV